MKMAQKGRSSLGMETAFRGSVLYCLINATRCDNTGENLLLQKRMKSKDWKFETEFQFTARATPQQNSPVEKKFDTLTGRGVSMMNAANLGREERCKLL